MKVLVNGKVIGKLREAKSFIGRTRGLMFRKDFDFALLFKDSGMLIHTYFMSHPMDVMIVKKGTVTYKRCGVKPWRFITLPSGDMYETPNGWLEDVNIGDKVSITE